MPSRGFVVAIVVISMTAVAGFIFVPNVDKSVWYNRLTGSVNTAGQLAGVYAGVRPTSDKSGVVYTFDTAPAGLGSWNPWFDWRRQIDAPPEIVQKAEGAFSKVSAKYGHERLIIAVTSWPDDRGIKVVVTSKGRGGDGSELLYSSSLPDDLVDPQDLRDHFLLVSKASKEARD